MSDGSAPLVVRSLEAVPCDHCEAVRGDGVLIVVVIDDRVSLFVKALLAQRFAEGLGVTWAAKLFAQVSVLRG